MSILSKYFTLEEFENSATARIHKLSNKMDDSQLANAKELCRLVLDMLRVQLNKPIVITSGFRGTLVNRLVGGSNTSAHSLGCAADIVVPGMSVTDLFLFIHDLATKDLIHIDQVIWEKNSWVHIGIKPHGVPFRNQWLKTTDGVNYTNYAFK